MPARNISHTFLGSSWPISCHISPVAADVSRRKLPLRPNRRCRLQARFRKRPARTHVHGYPKSVAADMSRRKPPHGMNKRLVGADVRKLPPSLAWHRGQEPAPACSADFQSAVAPNFIRRAWEVRAASGLKICATPCGLRQHVAAARQRAAFFGPTIVSLVPSHWLSVCDMCCWPARGACQYPIFNFFSFANLRLFSLAGACVRFLAFGLEAISPEPAKTLPAVCYISADECAETSCHREKRQPSEI